MFGWLKRREIRAADSVMIPVSGMQSFAELMGVNVGREVLVTPETAMSVPAVQAAVTFLADTLAALPFKVYRQGNNGARDRIDGGIAVVLDFAPGPNLSSFDWRKGLVEDVILNHGRHVSFINRNRLGRVVSIEPLDMLQVTIRRVSGQVIYEYRENGRVLRYGPEDVIDIPWMLKSDRLTHRSPIATHREKIGQAIALMRYANRFFGSGGVPPFVVTGNFQSPQAQRRAAQDFEAAVQRSDGSGLAMTLPLGLDVKSIGTDAAKAQMVEAQKFSVEEMARIWHIPPVFLQDLTHGTFSNTEQQDLNLVKHTLTQWCRRIEGQVNLKLFPDRKAWAELDIDGLLRGDFKTRMDGMATAIQHGIMLPNEARQLENAPPIEGGDKMYMQGAMMPVDKLGQNGPGTGGQGNG